MAKKRINAVRKSSRSKLEDRRREEEKMAHLEGLIRIGKEKEACRYLMRSQGLSEKAAKEQVERLSGAIGSGRQRLSPAAARAIVIIFPAMVLWVLTSVLAQNWLIFGMPALVLYGLRWLAPLIAAIGLIQLAIGGEGSRSTRLLTVGLAVFLLFLALPLLRGVVNDVQNGPVEETLTVSLKKHYGDKRLELVPKGAEPNRRSGHFVSADSIDSIQGHEVRLRYWSNSGVVISVKEA